MARKRSTTPPAWRDPQRWGRFLAVAAACAAWVITLVPSWAALELTLMTVQSLVAGERPDHTVPAAMLNTVTLIWMAGIPLGILLLRLRRRLGWATIAAACLVQVAVFGAVGWLTDTYLDTTLLLFGLFGVPGCVAAFLSLKQLWRKPTPLKQRRRRLQRA